MALNSEPVPYFTVESPLTQSIRAVRAAGVPLLDYVDADVADGDEPHFVGSGLDSVHVRMALVLAGMAMVGLLMLLLLAQNVEVGDEASGGEAAVVAADAADASAAAGDSGGATGVLSRIFTREVLHWEPQIVTWSELHGVDPNLAAIIMQIESCGDPGAVSSAGAQGLFQVMPFHFVGGENPQDPDTNAARGLKYFSDRLVQTNGDIGRAFAGYNGGHVAAAASWDSWASETQRYYLWSTGIYGDIMSGGETSPTLERWLAAGGAGLCQQAAARLGI